MDGARRIGQIPQKTFNLSFLALKVKHLVTVYYLYGTMSASLYIIVICEQPHVWFSISLFCFVLFCSFFVSAFLHFTGFFGLFVFSSIIIYTVCVSLTSVSVKLRLS